MTLQVENSVFFQRIMDGITFNYHLMISFLSTYIQSIKSITWRYQKHNQKP